MIRLRDIGQFIVRPVIFVMILMVLFGIFIHPASPISFNLETIRSRVDALGYWGPLYYILTVVLLELFAFPLVPLILMAGILFGKVGGAVTALIAATLSAMVSWGIARHLVHDKWREKIFKRLGVFAPFLLQKGILHVAVSRSLPVPFGVVSYAAGVIYRNIRPIVIGNLIGLAPWCVIYTWLGAYLLENKFLYLAGILVIILIMEIFLFAYWHKQNIEASLKNH